MLYKYPRTPHLPWSNSVHQDDRHLKSVDHLLGQEIVITVKMDGENTTIYKNNLHTRSLDSKSHVGQSWIRGWAPQWSYLLDNNERICGENMQAVHSIQYSNLKSYFYAFSYWIDNTCQSWAASLNKFNELNLIHPEILFRGVCHTRQELEKICQSFNLADHEGYVIRLTKEFDYQQFETSVAKWVRAGHLQTDHNWDPTRKNILLKSSEV